MDFPGHNCTLFQYFKKENIIDEHIELGIFVSARRRLKRFIMLDDKHPYGQQFVQSHAAREKEQERHLLRHPRMIHPFSLAALFIDFWIFGMLVFWYIMIPIGLAFANYMRLGVRYHVTTIVNFLYTAYVCCVFFVGYYDNEKNKVILEPGNVAIRYLKSYFIFDILSVTPTYLKLICYMFDIDGTTFFFMRYLNLLKIVRCLFCIEVLDKIRLYTKMTKVSFLIIKLVMSYVMIWSWSCGIMFCIRHSGVFINDTYEEVLESFYAATLVLLDVRFGLRARKNLGEMVTTVIFMCGGFVLQIYLFAKILQLWEKHYSLINKHNVIERQLQEYMKGKALPIYLRTNMRTYLDFKFQRQFYKEKSVTNIFSTKLKEEVMLSICESFVEKVELFFQLPLDMRLKILSTLATDVFVPNDIIIKAGSIGGCMYIISAGTVAIYSPNGKEICHLEDGAQFGEIALVYNHKRIATVVAISACEVYLIKRNDFLDMLEPYPALKSEVYNVAKDRYTQTTDIS